MNMVKIEGSPIEDILQLCVAKLNDKKKNK